ncbi:MAG: alpha/beta fold hydrolase [Candidatus Obscuribacterales bacterium]|nr:alpha/beta fold hydrolase [Candidatus Obscuribacterales bacterium]
MSQSVQDNSGQKRTGVVLIHGLTGTPTEMKPLEKYLRKLGFDVENVLLAGHGAGHDEMLDSNWKQWLESARQALHKIQARNEQAVVCGLSMGGIIAARLATEEANIAGVMMLSPTLSYDGSIMFNKTFDTIIRSRLLQRTMRNIIECIPAVGRKIFWEETPPYGISDVRIQRQITRSIEAARQGGSNEFGVFRTYYGSFVQMWSLIDDTRQRLAQISCPTVLVHSLDDTLASIDNATETYALVGSKNKTLAFLTGCDHVMTLDLQKQKVMKMLGNFVQSIANNSRAHTSEIIGDALCMDKPERQSLSMTLSNKRNAHLLSVLEQGRVSQQLPVLSGRFSAQIAAEKSLGEEVQRVLLSMAKTTMNDTTLLNRLLKLVRPESTENESAVFEDAVASAS